MKDQNKLINVCLCSLLLLSSTLALAFFKDVWLPILLLIMAVQWSSVIILISSVDKYIFNQSVFDIGRKELIELIIATLIFHIGLVSFGGALAKTMWFYPNLSLSLYAIMAPLGYVLYGFALYGLYETIEQYITPEKPKLSEIKNYRLIMKSELILGVFGLLASTKYLLSLINQYNIRLGFISRNPSPEISLWFFFVPWVSIFLVFEGLSYFRGRDTLTIEILNGEYSPIYASLAASLVGIAMIEIINVYVGVWKFVNWPYSEIKLFGLPILVYFSWPLQFPALMALIRFIFPKDQRTW